MTEHNPSRARQEAEAGVAFLPSLRYGLLPLFIASGPVLFLWSANAAYVRPSDALPVLLVVMVVVELLWVAMSVITARPAKSAATVALLAVPVLTFGHQLSLLPDDLGLPLYLALLVANAGLIVAALAAVWRIETSRYLPAATVAAALFVISTLPGIVPGLGSPPPSPLAVASGTDARQGPDVYVIVLDAYARADVLDEVYGFSNDAFLSRLERRGFFVAEESYSNYAMTHLSLASALNADYLTTDAPYDPRAVDGLIGEAQIIRDFIGRGYRYVFFETPWFGTDEAPLADLVIPWSGGGSVFQETFVRTTLVGGFLPTAPRHEGITHTFAELPRIAETEERTFTLAHVLAPHPPFMFHRDGSVRTYVDDLAAPFERAEYIEQLEHINQEVLKAIDQILERSTEPPVIVLQGDHGPALLIDGSASAAETYWERLGILNAVLGPPGVSEAMYPGVSPVNVFRIIANELLDADRPVLPDRAFYNWYDAVDIPAVGPDPLELRDVTEELP